MKSLANQNSRKNDTLPYFFIFPQKTNFCKASIKKDVLFLFEVAFIRPADFTGYEFGNPKW